MRTLQDRHQMLEGNSGFSERGHFIIINGSIERLYGIVVAQCTHTHTVLGYAKYAQSIFPKCLNYVQRDGVSFLAQEEEEEEKSHPGRIQIFFLLVLH